MRIWANRQSVEVVQATTRITRSGVHKGGPNAVGRWWKVAELFYELVVFVPEIYRATNGGYFCDEFRNGHIAFGDDSKKSRCDEPMPVSPSVPFNEATKKTKKRPNSRVDVNASISRSRELVIAE